LVLQTRHLSLKYTGESISQFGYHALQVGEQSSKLCPQHFIGLGPDEVEQRIMEGAQGQSSLRLVATPGENEQPPLLRLTCDLGKEARLADAWVADNEEEPRTVMARHPSGMPGDVWEQREGALENVLSPNERT
jgi:hypothetical protein